MADETNKAQKERPDATEAEALERALIEGYEAMADEHAQMAKEWEPLTLELWWE